MLHIKTLTKTPRPAVEPAPQKSNKIPVTNKNDVLVGYTDKDFTNISFLDNKEAKEIQKELLQRNTICLSAAVRGTSDEEGNILTQELAKITVSTICGCEKAVHVIESTAYPYGDTIEYDKCYKCGKIANMQVK